MTRLLLLFLCVALRASAAPPNIVMIIADDHAWTDYGFMGHPQIKTPHLDRLAQQSLTFPRGYVPSSLCCPSLASIITGKYPHQHKVTSNDPPNPQGLKPADFAKSETFRAGRETYNRFMDAQATLPRLLAQNGYLCLQTGKWWQGDFSRGGFTHGMTKGGRHGDTGLEIGRKTMQPIFDFVGEAQKAKKPFFLWYAPLLPHDPHTPPARLLSKYESVAPSLHVARYWAMIEWFDETIGELLAYLDREGLAQNTIVTFVADNGWIQNPDAPKYAPRSKQSQYDGGLRTPILFRWPGHVTPRRVETPISSLDLLPTLLRACDLQPPGDLPGLNLLDEAAIAARSTLFGECFTHNSHDLDNPAASLRWRYIIRDQWKLIVPHAPNESGAPELYHLQRDPMEEHNRFLTEPERAAEMLKALNAWWNPS